MYDLLVNNLNLHEGYNVEVTSLWFALCLKLKKPDSIKPIREFLGQHGRMKYLKPLYRGLIKYDRVQGEEIFKCHKY